MKIDKAVCADCAVDLSEGSGRIPYSNHKSTLCEHCVVRAYKQAHPFGLLAHPEEHDLICIPYA